MHPIERPDMPGIDTFDFYRCQRCSRLFTRTQELEAFRTGKVCPCGGLKYIPAWPAWYEWVLPRVLVFAYLRWRGEA
jgi:hypothetical protein